LGRRRGTGLAVLLVGAHCSRTRRDILRASASSVTRAQTAVAAGESLEKLRAEMVGMSAVRSKHDIGWEREVSDDAARL